MARYGEADARHLQQRWLDRSRPLIDRLVATPQDAPPLAPPPPLVIFSVERVSAMRAEPQSARARGSAASDDSDREESAQRRAADEATFDAPLLRVVSVEEREGKSEVASSATAGAAAPLFNEAKGGFLGDDALEIVWFGARAQGARQRGGSSPNAMSLETFRWELRASVSRAALARSSFFREKLAGEWARAVRVRLQVPRLATVHALQQALEYLCKGRVALEGRSLLELLALAHVLGLDQLVEVCITRAAGLLGPETVVPAASLGYYCGVPWLLQSAYFWLVRNVVESGAINKALAAAVPLGDSYVSVGLRQPPFFVPLAAFDALSAEQSRISDALAAPVAGRFVGAVVRERDSNGGKMFATYSLVPLGEERPLLTARLSEERGEYVLASGAAAAALRWADALRWQNPAMVGSVRSNVAGTHFDVFKSGVAAADHNPRLFPGRARPCVAGISYKHNILGTVPREFTLSLELDGRRVLAANREPVWNELLGAYTLDFGDKVKVASKKNFQIVLRDGELPLPHKLPSPPAPPPQPPAAAAAAAAAEAAAAPVAAGAPPAAAGGSQVASVLVFGKVRTDHFYIEFTAPFSPLSAMGLVLSAFDRKRLVT